MDLVSDPAGLLLHSYTASRELHFVPRTWTKCRQTILISIPSLHTCSDTEKKILPCVICIFQQTKP